MGEFYWQRMKKDVKRLVQKFDVCQFIKYDTIGLLQPLPVPYQAWTYISIDFIESSKLSGYDVIFVVVDQLLYEVWLLYLPFSPLYNFKHV